MCSKVKFLKYFLSTEAKVLSGYLNETLNIETAESLNLQIFTRVY